MALVKVYFATPMLNVSQRFSKDADSARVEMVGRETVELAPVRLNFNWCYVFVSGIK